MFKLFDDDETGKISFRNLKRVARELGENMTDEELQEMINKADIDGDGEVNEEEFLRIMTYKHSFKAEGKLAQCGRRWAGRESSARSSAFSYMLYFVVRLQGRLALWSLDSALLGLQCATREWEWEGEDKISC